MATACFCGLPLARSIRMFWLIVFWLDPFFNGITEYPLKVLVKRAQIILSWTRAFSTM
jgi:hypothetical protein